jgi:signal transduction histidine kinase/CheY-like chemotaxis protein
MSRTVKFRHLIPAAIALLVIVYGVATSAVNTRENLKDARLAAHSGDVLVAIQDLLSAMQDLKTELRGFLLTGSESYLSSYESNLKRVDEQFAILSGLTKNNAFHQEILAKAKGIVADEREILSGMIEVRREEGLESSLAAFDSGRARMDEFRLLIGEMRVEELKRLGNLRGKLENTLRETNFTVSWTGIVAIAAGASGTILLYFFLVGKNREERLESEKSRAQEADQAKSDFLAMMSHEIRTPMNAILGFGEMLHDSVKSPQEKHFVDAILSSGNALLTLINDILDLSKIEAGKLDFHTENVEMVRFAENLETLFSYRASQKGLDYVIRVDPSVPEVLSFDALRLRQVLVNLIGNGIKFSREGAVRVTIQADPVDDEDRVKLHIAVEDTGVGISEDQMEAIFRPFYQVDSLNGRHFQGTGLGLSISRRLMDAMNGKIFVQSKLGVGSVFKVEIPTHLGHRSGNDRPEGEGTAHQPIEFTRLARAKIVIADDIPINRDLIKSYIGGGHHQIYEAENGEDVLNLTKTFFPDLVLMDIRITGLAGQEVLEKLRSDEATAKIPLIAVTAFPLSNREEALRNLFDSYVSKPVSRASLFAELAKFLPVETSAETSNPSPDSSTVPERRDWSELFQTLETLKNEVWPGLVKLVPAQATLKFSVNLYELSVHHRCPDLGNYATLLMKSAEMMDFQESGRLLAAFPDILTKIAQPDA